MLYIYCLMISFSFAHVLLLFLKVRWGQGQKESNTRSLRSQKGWTTTRPMLIPTQPYSYYLCLWKNISTIWKRNYLFEFLLLGQKTITLRNYTKSRKKKFVSLEKNVRHDSKENGIICIKTTQIPKIRNYKDMNNIVECIVSSLKSRIELRHIKIIPKSIASF